MRYSTRYRVIAIDEQNLILRGIRSGEVLTIKMRIRKIRSPQKTTPPGSSSP